jgi:hypothetical protein
MIHIKRIQRLIQRRIRGNYLNHYSKNQLQNLNPLHNLDQFRTDTYQDFDIQES